MPDNRNLTPKQCEELVNIFVKTDEISVFSRTHHDIFLSYIEKEDTLRGTYKDDVFTYYHTVKSFFDSLQEVMK